MTPENTKFEVIFIVLLYMCVGSESIRCYQCSSNTDPEGQDICGAYEPFDKTRNTAIDCNSGESNMPGTFCVKLVQQGAQGFIWDGRWRQVIRKCASVASTGVTGVCNWGIYKNGVFWEECYCSDDSCNGASNFKAISFVYLSILVVIPLIFFSR